MFQSRTEPQFHPLPCWGVSASKCFAPAQHMAKGLRSLGRAARARPQPQHGPSRLVQQRAENLADVLPFSALGG